MHQSYVVMLLTWRHTWTTWTLGIYFLNKRWIVQILIFMQSISQRKIAWIFSRSMSTPRVLIFLCSSFSFNDLWLFMVYISFALNNPWMLLAVRLDVWNRSRRCTSLMWLCCWPDGTHGRPERWRSLVLPDCLQRLNNDCIELRWTPKCLATMCCANPAWSIPIAWRRWFSVKRGITLKSMLFNK
jgi:hypothetical protein